MRPIVLSGLVLVAACTTKVIEPVAPVAAPAAVAAAFMQAVADSNFDQMGELWGTNQGSAAATKSPPNWLQRVAVMHAYLKGGAHRVLGEEPGVARRDRRQLMIEISRSGCTRTVPFTMILTKQGSWLVNAIDLNAAGVPGRPCPAATTPSGATPRGPAATR
jgi:hypothetical protein